MTDMMPLESPIYDISGLPFRQTTKPVGRETELREIYDHLKNNRPVLLHGQHGVGKTTLAATLAGAFTQKPGGVIWLHLHNAPLPEILVRIGRAYEIMDITDSEDPVQVINLVARLLHEEEPMIVIDGELDMPAVASFVQRCAGNLPVLILHPEPETGPWIEFAVKPLVDTAAITLFKEKSNIHDMASDDDIAELVQFAHYLPLPIVIAARAMVASKQSPADYLNILEQIRETLNVDHTTAIISASYRAINASYQGLLLLLGATPFGAAGLDLLCQISRAPEDSIRHVMQILTNLKLIETSERFGRPYYQIPSLVLDVVHTWNQESKHLETLESTIQDAAIDYATVYSNPESFSFEKLMTEMDTFMGLAERAHEEKDRETIGVFASALSENDQVALESGYSYEQMILESLASSSNTTFPAYITEGVVDEEADETETFYEETIEPDDDEEDYDFSDEDEDEYGDDESVISPEDMLAMAGAVISGNIGDDDTAEIDAPDDITNMLEADHSDSIQPPSGLMAMFDEDEMEDIAESEEVTLSIPQDTATLQAMSTGELQSSLLLARQNGDTATEARLMRAIGSIQVRDEEHAEALETYNELLELYEAEDDQHNILDTLDMISSLHMKTGNPQAAIVHTRRAVDTAIELGEAQELMYVYMTQGDAYQELGESVSAVDSYSKALKITREVDDRQNEALALYKIGYAHLDVGDIDEAIHSWNQAIELFRTQQKRELEGETMGALGSAYAEKEDWDRAIKQHQSALDIARELGMRKHEAEQLTQLAQVYIANNELSEGLMRYRQALHLAYESKDQDAIITTTVDIVNLMLRSKRLISICMLLVNYALTQAPNDPELIALQKKLEEEKASADARGLQQTQVLGTAEEYARNAYLLLE